MIYKALSKSVQTSLPFRFSCLLTAALALSASPQNALAWGDTGHQVVGEIAERILADDRETMNAIQSIIGIEPLLISATFPDAVRSDARFRDFAPFHFLTIFRDSERRAEQDITTVFSKYPPLFTNPATPLAEQAIALRYIVHVTGDAHQPLHVGNEFDFGANTCTVNFQPTEDAKPKQTNLHSVWDTDIINAMIVQWKKENPSIKYFGATDIAGLLMKKYPELLAASTSVDTGEWLKESETLRKGGGVYPDQLPDDARPYCMKKASQLEPSEIPLLGPDYVAAARPVIEVQLVKGGARLAAFLKSILKNRRSATVDSTAILGDLKKKNDPKPPSAGDE